ncbi:PREDICTED: uncharacterized protein LOC104774528 isoform X1 [Camelina sativa]|uniref:Uncharacterized protein LOC104774528 isoform X1 n=1 Tax=Camelina sativa TaxID=90675 RepID=A0ABM0Y910_CAMSA|nr:PREDICTED: uncharacterized protein LOC104774528 isoform X1 [Camelina sativa]
MTGGDWIHEAMDDDSLVAQALICLLHSEPSSLPDTKCGGGGGASDLKLKWTVRQRRTKSASLRKKGDENNTRASPTTPLSWSGATSFSGGGAGAVDGFEESSGAVKLSEAVRSKISQTNVKTTIPFKRSRKKKTLAQLKEEESLLLKEKKGLKNELASMRELLKQQKARNESLKKMQAESQKNEDSSFLLPDLNIPLDNNNPSPDM